MVRLMVSLVLLGVLVGVPSHANDDAESAIKAVYADIHARFLAGDVGDIGGDYYTADGLLLPPMGGAYRGPEAISKTFEGMLNQGLILKPVPVEIEVHGDVAYELGKGYIRNKQGDLLAAEDYMVIWKREDGQWKIYRDIVRGTPPPAN